MKYGLVQGGVVPVSGASVQMYAVGTTGDGSAATPLFATPLVTDADGKFDYAGAYTCPSAGALVYMVATGGDPGTTAAAPNPQISMMTALGPCGNLTPTTDVTINEVTTVAAVYSLAPYMQGGTAVGAGTGDQDALAAAFKMAALLANPATGTTPGANAPEDATLPIAEINTLADILASCVDSAGGAAGDGSSCGTLDQVTTPAGGSAPTNTLSAALMLANNPSQGTAALFGLLPAITTSLPFQPVLMAAPASFALPATFPSGLAVSLAPSSFPDTSLGQNSQAVLTVTNNGTSAVHLSEPVLSGANATEFSFDLNGANSPCSTSSALAAQASCTITVAFTPAGVGAKTADLAIVSDAQNALIHVALSGKGVTPPPPPPTPVLSFTYTPDAISFDQYGVAKTLTVTNTGNEAFSLAIVPTYRTGPQYPPQDGSGWRETGSCIGAPIASGASCTVSLAMYEVAGIPEFLTLTAQAGADSTSQEVAVSETSVADLDAKPVDFGGWPVSETSAAQIVALRSPANTALQGTVTGPNAQEFVADCATTTGQCSILFTPGAMGTRTATLETQYGTVALTGTGQSAGPAMTISVSSPSPQPPPVGGKQTLWFTVVNHGSTSLTLSPTFVGQTNMSVFSAPTNMNCAGVVLAPAKQCTIYVTFSPTQPGPQPVSVQVKDTVSGLTVTKNYTATALNGNLALPSDSIDFGAAAVGQTTTWPVSISQTQLSFSLPGGAPSTNFTVTSGDFTLQGTPCGQDNPQKFCGYSVAFLPSATGLRTASFVLTDTRNNLSTTLSVQGTGAVASLQASADSITFPSTPVGTSSTQTVTVKNNGPVSVNTNVSFTGANNRMYSAGPVTCNSVSGSLAPGFSCTIGVVFTPLTTGQLNGTMQLSDGTVIALHGTATASTTAPPLSFSPATLDFGEETVGFTAAPRGLMITNSGPVTVDVNVEILNEQGQSDREGVFETVNSISCNGVRPGASCRTYVQFSPKTTGIRTYSLVVYSGSPGPNGAAVSLPQVVALSGTGLAPAGGPLTLSPAGGLFFSPIGTPQTATLENDGDTAVPIRYINYLDNNCPTELAAHAQCQIQVDGTYGDVSVSATSSSTPYTLPISVPPGQVSTNPGLIAFQAVPVGSSANGGYTSSRDVWIQIFSGVNASDFRGGTCYTDLREECTASLQFAPSGAGLRTAVVGIAADFVGSQPDPSSLQVYKVFGIGDSLNGADFTVSQNDFLSKIVPGYVGTVTLTNTGATPLLLYQDNKNNVSPTLLLQSASTPGCSLNSSVSSLSTPQGTIPLPGGPGVYLPTGQSCTVAVFWNITQGTGAQTQELRFTDALSGLSKSQTLSSDTGPTENAPTVTGGGDVGVIDIGATAPPVSFTISAPNNDGVVVWLSPIYPAPGVAYKIDAGTCAQKTPCQATLTVTPSVAGNFTLALNVYDPLIGQSSLSPVLSGAAGFPVVTFSPVSVDFGNQAVGVLSAAKQVTVTNTGQSSLRITGVTLMSDVAADFAVDSSNCTQGNIGVRQTCTLSVTFTPHGAGTRSGTLHLVSNEQAPSSLTLTGVGTQ